MTWLRLDDKFLEHPKIVDLSPSALRTWLGVLLYCARYRTRGAVPASALKCVHLTPSRVREFTARGLLEPNGDGYQVHDFEQYNGSRKSAAKTTRKRRQRA